VTNPSPYGQRESSSGGDFGVRVRNGNFFLLSSLGLTARGLRMYVFVIVLEKTAKQIQM